MTDLMTIGEFAAATWLSPKALRLYDRNGLLSPDSVDPFNGYRKYSPAQIEVARLITMLRRIDMPLEQISELLKLPPEARPAHFVPAGPPREVYTPDNQESVPRCEVALPVIAHES